MKRISSLLVLCVALLLAPLVAQAHSDGTAQLIGVNLGACQISAWTWPEPLVTGDPSHVSVLVIETAPPGETGDILLDSEVEVTFAPQDGSSNAISAAATHELADVKFFYETEAELAEAGTWDILIKVRDDDTACEGEAGFSVPVSPGPVLNWPLVAGIVVIVAGAIGLAVWQLRQRQKAD